VLAYERGHPVREGIITGTSIIYTSTCVCRLGDFADTNEHPAYGDTMHIIIIVALVLSIIPMLLSFFLPDWYLSDKRNAVEEEDERQPKGY
jgi:Na+-driven multidrug efflux pump